MNNNNISRNKFRDVSDTDVLSAIKANEDDELHSPERSLERKESQYQKEAGSPSFQANKLQEKVNKYSLL